MSRRRVPGHEERRVRQAAKVAMGEAFTRFYDNPTAKNQTALLATLQPFADAHWAAVAARGRH